MSADNFDPHALRRALGNFATGITIVTAQAPDGSKIGLTVNSFNSVSLQPPLILWSLDKRSASSLEVLHSAGHFAVNVLAADQIALSNRFARPQEDKFAGIAFSEGPGNAPLLEGCAARFHCALEQEIDAGDHWILLGRVLAFDDFGRAPLLYHQGAYSLALPHPQLQNQSKADSGGVFAEKLSNNLLYLLLQAVSAYQNAYLPKQTALGLSVSEARILILLSALTQGTVDKLQRESNLPGSEITEALARLAQAGLVGQSEGKYQLTDAGLERAEQYWHISQQEQEQVLMEFSAEETALFKRMLKGIMQHA